MNEQKVVCFVVMRSTKDLRIPQRKSVLWCLSKALHKERGWCMSFSSMTFGLCSAKVKFLKIE
jgi:hypothetical protein